MIPIPPVTSATCKIGRGRGKSETGDSFGEVSCIFDGFADVRFEEGDFYGLC